jgi:predicted PurR-regulated permease PerM
MLNKLSNNRLLTIVLALTSLYLITLLWPTLLIVIRTIFNILLPFIVGFIVADILVPFVNYLHSKKINRSLAILIVTIGLFGFITLIGFAIIPATYRWVERLVSSYQSGLTNFGDYVLINLNIDIRPYINDAIIQIQKSVDEFKENFISNAAILIPEIAGMLVSFIMQAIFCVVISLYVLGDSSNVKGRIIVSLAKINKDLPVYIKSIDIELRKYFNAYIKLFFIKIIEYIIIYWVLGNNNYIALGMITGLSIFIPYVGGLLASFIGIITLPTSTSLTGYIVATLVLTIMSNVDEYLISPKVYSSTLKVSPLLILFAVFAGSTLYGFTGVIIAIPMMVIINISILTHLKLKKEKESNE